jgi:2-oxoglutarate ferredoxin oxidoreductase subunit delta
MPRIIVDERYCKGCALCVSVCPTKCIGLDPDTLTDKGYHPAMLTEPEACTGCASCAVMCPDVAITVER